MYTHFFGLNEKPFSITPDPRYLYLSERHAEALAHLLYGVTESGGFVQLTGEVGTGKTTLVRSLLEQLPKDVEIALILNPRLSPNEFLRAICEERQIELPESPTPKDLVDRLNTHLLAAHAAGRRVVVMVDEAQNLSADVLEQVRLLTNLETSKQKLLQIILIGQPELRQLLARNDLRQLAQRITGRYHLDPLSRKEAIGYLRHRAQVAGATGDLMSAAAMRELHRLSGGVPRLMNVIADRALLGAYSEETAVVNRRLIRQAAAEVFGKRFTPGWLRATVASLGILGALMIGAGLWQGARLLNISHDGGAIDQASASQPQVATQAESPVQSIESPPPEEEQAVALTIVDGPPIEPPVYESPPPPPPGLAEIIAADPRATTTEQAFARLFSLWGAHYQPGAGLACDQASAQGLRCLFQQGALGSLRKLNRPVIMALRDDAGQQHNIVLATLSDEQATITVGAQQFMVSIAELSRYWEGDYLLLWRPQTRAPTLSVGMRGEDVIRLRRSLQAIEGDLPTAQDPSYFDEILAEHIRDYQRSRKLAPDGIVGARTQIVMSSELGIPDTPYLLEGG